MTQILFALYLLFQTPQYIEGPPDTRSLEQKIKEADSVLFGEVSLVTEKLEKLQFDGLELEFLTVTVQFKNIEIVRGDKKRTTIRQYSSLARSWKRGEHVFVLLEKPTALNYDPIIYVDVVKDKDYLEMIRRVAKQF